MKNNFLEEPCLDQRLVSYQDSGYYPFHMPGHKRAAIDFPNPYAIDITEIDGFDNLHHATDILKDAQERAARLYGAKHSFFLVNGSTGGILSAISAALPRGGTLLMGRNCHKSAYHAAYIWDLDTLYLIPPMTDFGILGSVSPKDVALALSKHPETDGVFLTSPTYDGVVSDIKAIAAIVHTHGLPLIVDEAHGAHFPFSGHFPDSALSCGADLVIQSLHKTLPCLTQTALLHVNSDRVPLERVKQFLGIYQTSSPSYPLMASMEQCLRTMKQEGRSRMADFTILLADFYEKASGLKHLRLFPSDIALEQNCFGRDFSKILIAAGTTRLTGQELYDILLTRFHLQLEMVSGHYVTALTSMMDSRDGFRRLLEALYEIEELYVSPSPSPQGRRTAASLDGGVLYPLLPRRLSIREALERPSVSIELAESAGHVSGEYLYLYPPGIPLLAPGEEITPELLKQIQLCLTQGLNAEGLCDMTNQRINIVKI